MIVLRAFTPLALLSLIAASCGPDSDSSNGSAPQAVKRLGAPRHILIVSVDTLRADHLGCYGYPKATSPRLDKLAREGVLFHNATAPKGQTWPSLTSMLTGLPPLSHGVRSNHVNLKKHVPTIAHAAAKRGYRRGAFLANYGLALQNSSDRGFDRVFRADRPRTGRQDHWDQRAVLEAAKWIASDPGAKTLTWVHLMDPHRPYTVHPAHVDLVPGNYAGWLADAIPIARIEQGIQSGEVPITTDQFESFLDTKYWKQAKSGGTPTYRQLVSSQSNALAFDEALDMITLLKINLNEEDLAYVKGRYDSQVRGCDDKLAHLLDTLDELGLSDETLVIFTGDHGDELFDHQHYFFHSSSIYESVLRIPLVMRWPGRLQAGLKVENLVELMDVMPTLQQLLDVPLPEGVEAESLVPLLGGPGTYVKTLAFSENLPGRPTRSLPPPPVDAVYAVRDRKWKFIFNPANIHPRTPPYISVENRAFAIRRQELYDLASDPREQKDYLAFDGSGSSLQNTETQNTQTPGQALTWAQQLLAAYHARTRLMEAMQEWIVFHLEVIKSVKVAPVSDDVAETLAAMGYVSGTPSTGPQEFDTRPEQLRLLDEIVAVARTASEQPGNPTAALVVLGEAHFHLGNQSLASKTFERALSTADQDGKENVQTIRKRLGL